MLIWVKGKDEESTLWLENARTRYWDRNVSGLEPVVTLGETWVMKRVTWSLLLLNHAEFCLPNGSTIGPIVLMCINKGPFWAWRRLEWLFEYSKIMTNPTSKINMFSISCTLYSGPTLALTKLSISSSENTSGSDCFLIHVSKVQLWKMSWHFSSVSFMCFHCLFELPKTVTVTVNFAKNTTLKARPRELVK